MKQYYILINGRSQGPFTPEDLKQKGINQNTMVWNETLEGWKNAGMLPELENVLAPLQPPRVQSRISAKTGFSVMSVLILFLIGAIGMSWIDNREKKAKEEAKIDQREYEKEYTKDHIQELVHVTPSTYSVGLLGGVSGLKVSLTNGSEFLMDVVSVEINYIKANGSIFKTEVLNFSNLKPHTCQTQHAPESKRGSKIECNVSYVKSVEIGL
jgi:hypothetical protein